MYALLIDTFRGFGGVGLTGPKDMYYPKFWFLNLIVIFILKKFYNLNLLFYFFGCYENIWVF